MTDEAALRERLATAETALASFDKRIERDMAAANRSIDLARTDLWDWKHAHNEWQRQMRETQTDYVRRSEYNYVIREIDGIKKLVYIGLGIVLCVQTAILCLFAYLKK